MLIKVQALLKSRDWEPQLKDQEWKELHPELITFASDGFKRLVQRVKPKEMRDIDFDQRKREFQSVLGFAAFHDLQRQHLVWMLDYEPKVVPVAKWIYSFQNPQWDQELRKVLHGSAASPAKFRKQYKTSMDSARKKRSRRRQRQKKSTSKSVDKTQVKPVQPSKKRGRVG